MLCGWVWLEPIQCPQWVLQSRLLGRESWHRRGAASAAIQTLSRVAFSELQLGRVEIVVAADNAPSLALAAKSGALRECLARNRLKVHGKFTDAYVFSLVPESSAQSLSQTGGPIPT
ncbi:GNAT family N-acetyltransferase [Variovorax paradoxus]|uniref:GNAT family N-acetyltransferase n=1 Tax=Variovorax paradoxus TaxID=34073 RepID=UPI0035BE1B56